LLVVSIYIMKLKRNFLPTLLPMIFVIIVAFWASGLSLITYFQQANWLLVILSLAVMAASIVVMLEALSEISKIRKGESDGDGEDAVPSSGE